IGRATALALAAAGAAVGLVARGRRDLETAAKEIEDAGGRALVCEADLADPSALRAPLYAGGSPLGRLDLVINKARMAPARPAVTSDDFAAWEAVLRVNLDAVFRLCRLAGRELIARRHGSIVNVGSIGGASALVVPQPGYAATKAALSGLTTALAAEWAPLGV